MSDLVLLELDFVACDGSKSIKVKQSLYTPWRRLGGEEI
jgi:hypothetical protein